MNDKQRAEAVLQISTAMGDERELVRKMLQFWRAGNADAAGFAQLVVDMSNARQRTDALLAKVLDCAADDREGRLYRAMTETPQ